MIKSQIDTIFLKIGLAKILIVIIALPANTGVAQRQLSLATPGYRHELLVNNEARDSQPLSRTVVMAQTTQKNFKVGSKRSQIFRGFEGEDSSKARGYYQSPFPRSWAVPRLRPTILNVKNFNLVSSFYYDNNIDELGFSLLGRLEASARVSVQLAVFAFYVPRPWITSAGAGAVSDISNYQLTGSFCLQKYK